MGAIFSQPEPIQVTAESDSADTTVPLSESENKFLSKFDNGAYTPFSTDKIKVKIGDMSIGDKDIPKSENNPFSVCHQDNKGPCIFGKVRIFKVATESKKDPDYRLEFKISVDDLTKIGRKGEPKLAELLDEKKNEQKLKQFLNLLNISLSFRKMVDLNYGENALSFKIPLFLKQTTTDHAFLSYDWIKILDDDWIPDYKVIQTDIIDPLQKWGKNLEVKVTENEIKIYPPVKKPPPITLGDLYKKLSDHAAKNENFPYMEIRLEQQLWERQNQAQNMDGQSDQDMGRRQPDRNMIRGQLNQDMGRRQPDQDMGRRQPDQDMGRRQPDQDPMGSVPIDILETFMPYNQYGGQEPMPLEPMPLLENDIPMEESPSFTANQNTDRFRTDLKYGIFQNNVDEEDFRYDFSYLDTMSKENIKVNFKKLIKYHDDVTAKDKKDLIKQVGANLFNRIMNTNRSFEESFYDPPFNGNMPELIIEF